MTSNTNKNTNTNKTINAMWCDHVWDQRCKVNMISFTNTDTKNINKYRYKKKDKYKYNVVCPCVGAEV